MLNTPFHSFRFTVTCLFTLSGGLGSGLFAQTSASTDNTAEIIHVLNRTSFGIRPGDVEAVQKMGLQNYLQQQLHPETIDDSAADQAAAQLPTTLMAKTELIRLDQVYTAQRQAQVKLAAQIEAQAAAQGITINTVIPGIAVKPLPAPVKLLATTGGSSMNGPSMNGPDMTMEPTMSGATGSDSMGSAKDLAKETTPATPPTIPPLTAASAQAQVTALLTHDEGPLPTDPLGRSKERLRRATEFNPNLPTQQLQQAKLVRAVDSNRQLQEVLVDFWSNHFNVDARKDNVRLYLVSYDKDTIRPHILGKFRDLLEATAQSPAMLLYLDNASNIVPSQPPKNPAQAAQFKRQGGLNENYGREIMELHCLGVDAGYTQKDVQEVARCFTGWTFDRKTGDFAFKPQFHDNGPKTVLGHEIPPNGGMQDGETVLDILTTSPQCAHFISKEMCQRFVSDNPSPALVNRIADVFQKTGGDLRAVTEAILNSPEFLSPSDFGNKIKSPEEFVISAVRASGSTIVPDLNPDITAAIAAATTPPTPGTPLVKHGPGGRRPLRGALTQLGEPLYNCSPPTGYKEVSSTWVNPGALIGRLNFVVSLIEANVNDVSFDAHKVLGDIDLDKPDAVLDRCVSVLLQNKISDSTRKVLIANAVPAPGVGKTIDPSKLIALILGSPEFQRK